MTKFSKFLAFVFLTYLASISPLQIYQKYTFLDSKSLSITRPMVGVYVLEGVINLQDCSKVKVEVPATPRPTIILESPGGAYGEGLCIARYFREINAKTIVTADKFKFNNTIIFHPKTNICASACVYMFMGGTERVLIGNANLGIHNPATPSIYLKHIIPEYNQIISFNMAYILLRFIDELGYTDEYLRYVLFNTPNFTMFWLHPDQFLENEGLKSIATEYINFYGFNFKEK